jgi:nucleoside-triphosphatase THEP1
VLTIVDLAAETAVDAAGPMAGKITQLLVNVEQAIADATEVLVAAEERQAEAVADVREAEQVVRRLERLRIDLTG